MSKASNYVVFDFETGGLKISKNAATEIAMITVDSVTLQEIERLQMLIKPYHPDLTYEAKALEITGITMEMVNTQGKDLHTEVVPAIRGLLSRANTAGGFKHKPILVGHNPWFDWGFLYQLGTYTKTDWSKLLMGGLDSQDVWIPKLIDTIDDSKQAFQGLDELKTSFTLANCAEYLQIPLSDAHRAMADTEITKNIFIEFLKRKRSEGGGERVGVSIRDHFKIA